MEKQGLEYTDLIFMQQVDNKDRENVEACRRQLFGECVLGNDRLVRPYHDCVRNYDSHTMVGVPELLSKRSTESPPTAKPPAMVSRT